MCRGCVYIAHKQHMSVHLHLCTCKLPNVLYAWAVLQLHTSVTSSCAQAEAAGRIVQGAWLAAYEAVRFKKEQPALKGGSWTSLEQLEVLLPDGEDAGKTQQAVDRSAAMAKGAIVTRFV